jgi:hypothetical protein
VSVLLEGGWDPAEHSCTLSLLEGGNTHAATVVTDVPVESGTRRTARFELGAAIDSCRIRIEGTTSAALLPYHVAERLDVAL